MTDSEWAQQIDNSMSTLRLAARISALSSVTERLSELEDKQTVAGYKNEVYQHISAVVHYVLTKKVGHLLPFDNETAMIIGTIHGLLRNTIGSMMQEDNIYLAEHLSILDYKIKQVLPEMDKNIMEMYDKGNL